LLPEYGCILASANKFAATSAKSAFADWTPDREGGLGNRSRDFNRYVSCQNTAKILLPKYCQNTAVCQRFGE